jgi:hypothetical protein
VDVVLEELESQIATTIIVSSLVVVLMCTIGGQGHSGCFLVLVLILVVLVVGIEEQHSIVVGCFHCLRSVLFPICEEAKGCHHGIGVTIPSLQEVVF